MSALDGLLFVLFQAEDEVERRIDFKVDRQLKRLEDK